MIDSQQKPIKPITIIIVILLIGVIAQFASDNYLPSLPAIASYFHAPSQTSKLTISFYMFGMVVAQFIFGPLSDSFGRKPILLIGFMTFILASIFATIAPDIEMLLGARILQGIGMGSAAVLYKTILRDVSSGEKFAKLASYILVFVALTPPLAPVTGGYIQHFFGWRENFLLVTMLGLMVTIIFIIWMPETLDISKQQTFSFKKVLKNFATILANVEFIKYTLFSSFTMSIVVIYDVSVVFLYQHVLGLTPIEYGWLSVFSAFSMLIGGMLNSVLISKVSVQFLNKICLLIMFVTSIIMLNFGLQHILNLYVILLPMVINFICVVMIFINSMSLAFDKVFENTGSASAVFGGLQALILSSISVVAAFIPDRNQIGITLAFVIISGILVMILFKPGFFRISRV